MMTLDECIAAARLPIRVTVRKRLRFVGWKHIVPTDKIVIVVDGSAHGQPRQARMAYVALRTRLSEQQGEKR